MKTNIKSILLLLAVFLSLCACQETDEEPEIIEEETVPLALIPSTNLNGWDIGYIYEEEWAVCYKKIDDENGYLVSLNKCADTSEFVVVSLDSDLTVESVMTRNDSFIFLYSDDEVTIAHHNAESDQIDTHSLPYEKIQSVGTLVNGPSTKATVSEVEIAFKAAQLGLNLANEADRNEVVTAIAKIVLQEVAEYMAKNAVKKIAQAIIPGAGIVVTLLTTAYDMKQLYDAIMWRIEKELFGFGSAEPHILSISNTSVTINISKLWSANPWVYCGMKLTYVGPDQQSSSTYYAGMGDPIIFNYPRMKYGLYIIEVFLYDGKTTGRKERKNYYCTSIDEAPRYDLNHSSEILGPGKLSLTLSAHFTAVKKYWFFDQFLAFKNAKGATLLTAGTHPYNTDNSIKKTLSLRDLAVDYSSYTVRYPINIEFFYNENSYCRTSPPYRSGRIPFSGPELLLYSEKPSMTFLNFESNTVPLNTKSDNPDNPDIIYYATTFSADCLVSGCFWINNTTLTPESNIVLSDYHESKGPINALGQQVISISGAFTYSSEVVNKYAVINADMSLIQGRRILQGQLKVL